VKIINLGTPFKIDVKRFYLPCEIEDACTACGQIVKLARDNYLAYPVTDTPTELHFYHGDCPNNQAGTEWSRRVILKVSLEIVP
jgi:hypothetical protein